MEPIIGTPQDGAGADIVKDSDSRSFQADVLDASHEVPVIVDFWAPWCEPCKQLGPTIEKVVRKTGGRVRLVKIDIDQSPDIAQAMRVQSIPAVYAFDQGRPVDGFVGAQPESEIKAFVERLIGEIGPSPVEQALEHAKSALQSKDYGTASALFGQILQHEAGNPDAVAGLARCYLAAGDAARAREVLDKAGDEHRNHPEIVGAVAALALAEQASESAGETAENEARVAANANDHQARLDLAMALYAAGRNDEAIDHLLEIVRRDRAWNDEAARKQLLTFFEALGPMDPLVVSARRQLSSILFS
jgi:putative thioredoxin